MNANQRQARCEGAAAWLAAQLNNAKMAANPYPSTTKRAFFWQWGVDIAKGHLS